MLERAVEVTPHVVRGPDDGLAHHAGLASGVQLVDLEVDVRVGRVILGSRKPTAPLLTGQRGRVASGSVIAWE